MFSLRPKKPQNTDEYSQFCGLSNQAQLSHLGKLRETEQALPAQRATHHSPRAFPGGTHVRWRRGQYLRPALPLSTPHTPTVWLSDTSLRQAGGDTENCWEITIIYVPKTKRGTSDFFTVEKL